MKKKESNLSEVAKILSSTCSALVETISEFKYNICTALNKYKVNVDEFNKSFKNENKN